MNFILRQIYHVLIYQKLALPHIQHRGSRLPQKPASFVETVNVKMSEEDAVGIRLIASWRSRETRWVFKTWRHEMEAGDRKIRLVDFFQGYRSNSTLWCHHTVLLYFLGSGAFYLFLRCFYSDYRLVVITVIKLILTVDRWNLIFIINQFIFI